MNKVYYCPMHKDVVSEKPGKCPKCGMELVQRNTQSHEHNSPHEHQAHAKHEHRHHDIQENTEELRAEHDHSVHEGMHPSHSGHKAQHKGHQGGHSGHGHHIQEIKVKAIVSSILTIPVVLYSESIQELLGFKMPSFPGSEWITPVLATIVFFYGGLFFLKGMLEELKLKKPGMMTLIGVAISVAFLYSLSTLIFGGKEFFWELTTLIVVMLWGHWIEMKSVLGASRALEELVKLMPTQANLIKGEQIVQVHVSELKPGDIVLVKPGEKIPADGVIIEGSTHVNESMLTGESKPVPKGEGDKVIGGALNMEGAIKVKIQKTGEETYLHQVLNLVKEAQESKTKLQDMADRVAFYLTLIALGVGGLSFLVWIYLSGDAQFAVERAVTVMVIACPHALGLAIPLVVAFSTSYSAKHGILVRNRLALETVKDIDAVMFDKTGTLTEGRFGVSDVVSESLKEEDFLRLVASVEVNSEHVIARAIVEEAENRGLSLAKVEDFRAVPGKGIIGRVEGREVAVGTALLMKEINAREDEEVLAKVRELESQGKTVVLCAIDGKVEGCVALSDRIRKESYQAIKELKALGKRVVMITGDSEEVAKFVAKELGVDEVFARVLPHQKAEKVKELQRRGMKVAMVGDGVNDAPALATADVGIAIGSGTDVAVESADIILVKNNPLDVVRIIRLSVITVKKMVQNLFWAAGYNVFTIPLAAGVAYPWGIVLKPAVGAVFMSASTVVVAINALLMRKSLR